MYGGLQCYDFDSGHFERRIDRRPTSIALVVTPSPFGAWHGIVIGLLPLEFPR